MGITDFKRLENEPLEILERTLKKTFTRIKLLENDISVKSNKEVALQKEQAYYRQIEKLIQSKTTSENKSPSIRELILNDYLSGKTDVEEIALLGGTTSAYVYKVISAFKKDIHKQPQPAYVLKVLKGYNGVLPQTLALKTEVKKQVLQLVSEGKAKKDIAEQLGVSRDFVYDVCKTYTDDDSEELAGYKIKLVVIEGKLVLIFKNLIITIDLDITDILEKIYIYYVISIVTPEGDYIIPLAKILTKKLKHEIHYYHNLYSAFPERFKDKKKPNKVGEIANLSQLQINNIKSKLLGIL